MSYERTKLTLKTKVKSENSTQKNLSQEVPKEPPELSLKEPVVAAPARIKGILEVHIKITELPNWVETLDNKKQRICINAGGQIVQMTLRPKVWNKLIQANAEYPLWVAAITGTKGPRTDTGFELLEVGVQVFEKKPK